MLLIECIERGTVDVMHGWRGGGGGAAHRGRARARRPAGARPAGGSAAYGAARPRIGSLLRCCPAYTRCCALLPSSRPVPR
jgi:hypothetical protein